MMLVGVRVALCEDGNKDIIDGMHRSHTIIAWLRYVTGLFIIKTNNA